MGVTLWALEALPRIAIAATGTITLPTGLGFASGDDYEVFTVEGWGGVDPGTKTKDDFDYTVDAGATSGCVVLIVPRTPKAKVHID